MTSTIKVNNVQNQCGQNIINENSNTITIGASGDTIALASGASQTGFGRTGTVDWQTGSIKTATFTAANGEGYFANTSGGAFTMNLPAGTAGSIVSVVDYTNTFQTNNLTVSPNGSDKIGGQNTDATLSVKGQSVTFVYVDGTEGWKNIQDSTSNVTGTPPFIQATGGTITCCGDYKIHTFTGPGTFEVTSLSPTPADNTIDYLIVAGGGGGGSSNGAGGGAGGFRLSNATCMPAPLTSPLATPTGITATITSYPIVVGGGGSGSVPGTPGVQGSDSSGFGISSAGGGLGKKNNAGAGVTGGSGGGGSGTGTGGAGNTPPVSPPQGNAGGNGFDGVSSSTNGGGGGGAGGAACNAAAFQGGNGGIGSFVVAAGLGGCNGTPGPVGSTRYFAGGGGGATAPNASPPNTGGTGGFGGGGAGSGNSNGVGGVGGVNTGGGGGGGGGGPTVSPNDSFSGGSGIVIIRYKFQ